MAGRLNWRPAAVGGGIAFTVFWLGGLLDMSTAWELSLALHAATILMLAWAGISIQRERPAGVYRLLGWAAVLLIVAGLLASMELQMVGMLLFGVTVGVAPIGAPDVRGRAAVLLLVVGSAAFLITRTINGPFWGDGTPDPSPVAALGFGLSLVALDLGWVALGLTASRGENVAVRAAT